MTKKQKEETILKWRLGNLPSVQELRDLVADGLITKEEAKQILFSEETISKKTSKEQESEIKFLRELVDKLSEGRLNTVYKYIEHVYPTYQRYTWPYWTVIETDGGSSFNDSVTITAANSTCFSSIK